MRRRALRCNNPLIGGKARKVRGNRAEFTPKDIDCRAFFLQFGSRNDAEFAPVTLKDLTALAGACAAICSCAAAQPHESAKRKATAGAGRPVVVEMFLSQSCSQSPPAAELLQSIADRPDVVALTWHVDYWDTLPAPGVGAWKDPFANPDFGARQISYNRRLRGRATKMTPQAVIDGVISIAGSDREALERRIVEAQFLDEMSRPVPPSVTVARGAGKEFRTRIENVGVPYDVTVVEFRKSVSTKIGGGDNAGVSFREANVVRAMSKIAADHSGPGEFSFAAPENGFDCAVLVQERGNGRIVAARYCSGAE